MPQKPKRYRSSGHSTIRAARMREAAIDDFKRWYFKEYGDVLPDDMYSMFRRGFNVGWKSKKQYDRM